jgi:DNA-binding winged helix-turn-helix (wHTH) protein
MDQIIPRVLRFDRFALDLTRGCLRLGDLDIDLRPKVFEVLRYLAENAGRLVSKQELVEAVWPNVAVTDDSLVQCIRELRNKLGDADHSLIKTVPRRGYLLDASMAARQSGERADQPSPHPIPVLPHASAPSPGIAQALRRCSPRVWGVAAAVVCLAVGATFLSARWLSPSTASEFFNQDNARHVAAIATDKELPLPPFEINRIDRDVLAQFRRFVGVWVSSKGFINSNRQFMLVLTNVEKSGIVTGFAVRGPRQDLSLVAVPAGSSHFKARISGDSFRYSGPSSEREVVLIAGNQLEFKEVFNTGMTVRAVLEPVWTLVEAEHAAGSHASAR